jgi:ligand-binding sensor domain-containing protein/signal transduction histidine kinase
LKLHPASLHKWSSTRFASTICTVFLLAGYSFYTHAQVLDFGFDHISVGQGLSNVAVITIVRDQQGFMWFGTLDGLCRYDGYEVTVFRHHGGNANSISDNVIWSLCVDGQANLWVGTYGGGLNKYDRARERFVRYKHDPADSGTISSNSIRAICEDGSGVLWVGTYGGGLNWLNSTTGEFRRFSPATASDNNLSRSDIRTIKEDLSGNLWIGTRDSGLYIVNHERSCVVRFVADPANPRSIPNNSIGSICQGTEGTVWIGTAQGLARSDGKPGEFTRLPFVSPATDNNISALCETDDRTLLIGTFSGGLIELDTRTATIRTVVHQPANPSSLSDNSIRTIFKDVTGAIWIGTSNGGVNKINSERKHFELFAHDQAKPGSLGKGELWSVIMDHDGTLWVGTSAGGLNKLNRESGTFTQFAHDPSDPYSLADDRVAAICEDRVGNLWVGTRGGLDKMLRSSGRFIHYKHDPQNLSSLSRNEISAIYEDRSGTLWVGTWEGGLNKFDRESSRFARYVQNATTPHSLSNNRVTIIVEDSSGTLWIGTEGGGLCELPTSERNDGKFIRHRNDPVDTTSLSNDRVYGLFVGGPRHLWVGTASGLNRFDMETRRFTRFFASSGFVSDYIRAIVGDNRGNLWLSTTRGLVRFTPSSGEVRNYDARNGLQGDEFSDAWFKSADGRIFVGGAHGLSVFHPDSIRDNALPPAIVLTGSNVFEKPAVLDSAVGAISTITLSYWQDFFSFSFAALDYTNPAKNRYKYRMEGFDRDWVDAGTRRYASYTNLDPGGYVFRVTGSNSDGIWNESGVSLAIVITPPFWETWWFRILALAFLLGILAAIYNYRVSKLLEMERMRIRIASDLHDDIGSSLSGIALVTDMVRNRLPDGGPERHQLAEASRVARHTADALKDIVWIINPEHDKLDDIVLRMKDAAAKLLLGVEYSFHCSESFGTNLLDMEFRRHLLLIYKEILNNAAKYSHATKVDIRIQETDGTLSLAIVDNGIGFDLNTVQRGNGLINMQRRAEKLGGAIAIESTPGCGTKVIVTAKIP